MPNQYKPLPPIPSIEQNIRKYWRMALTHKGISLAMQKHIDTDKYGLGVTSVKRVLNTIGLKGTRQQKRTVDTITELMEELRSRYPTVGSREIVKILFSDYDVRVSRDVIQKWCRLHEPEAVKARRIQRFRRRRIYSAGVNHIWSVDQHDKWRKYNLCLHLGTELFSRKLLWMNIWWTNSNPRLITSYYINAVEENGGLPLLTQSDGGSENYGMANSQTVVRQTLDPSLEGTLQHRWTRRHNNIKAEQQWSQMRNTFAPGFEDTLEEGVALGFYNTDDYIHALTFRWLAIPWLQAELDRYRERFNQFKPRFDRGRVGPCAPPDLIFEQPQLYKCRDFKVKIAKDSELLQNARMMWAPPNHPVFELVPPQFAQLIENIYKHLGSPAVSKNSFWDVYRQVLDAIENIDDDDLMLIIEQQYHNSMQRAADTNEFQLMDGQADLSLFNPDAAAAIEVGDAEEEVKDDSVYDSFSEQEEEDYLIPLC